MQLLDTVLGWSWHDHRLTLRTPLGALTLTPLAGDLVRLTLDATADALVLDSGAVVKRDWAPPAGAAVSPVDGGLVLAAGEIKAVIGFSPVRIDWYKHGRLFASDRSFMVGADRITVTRSLPEGEHCYGFGEKTGFLNKRGRRMEMWATDQGVMVNTDPLYQSIPFYIGLKDGQAHGLFVDCTARSIWDMGSREPAETATIEIHSLKYDAYVFAGPDMRQVVERYTELTGRMQLPPLWSLGYHQCRYTYYPETRVREIARLFRERNIPCDAIWLDIDYMDGYRVFTWDKERFPDPKALTADLAADGFKLVTIVDPGVKVDPSFAVYQEGLEKGYYAKNPDGTAFVGRVWPGPSVFPDFLQAGTRHWWGDHLKAGYLDNGVAGIWNDMNEPANQARNELNEKTLPYQTRQGEDGRQVPHKDVHNAYGFRMGQATFEGLRRHNPDKRPFVLTRSGYAGIQRYAAVWTGDNYAWWEGLLDSIPMCLGLGLSGVAFAGADIGGFGESPSGELLTRWLQAAAFTPFFRNHSCKWTRDQEPWAFGATVEDICRKYIELRYRLLPYFYTLFEEAARTGLPVMRPLVLEYQHDLETAHISDQFLLGHDLLVAPVYQPGVTRRLVYLPEGIWYDFWTGERHEGARYVVASAPLDTVPLFARAGAVIPMAPAMAHVGAAPVETLTLHIFPGQGSFTVYTDAGDGYGSFARLPVAVEGARAVVGKLQGDYVPEWQAVAVVVHGIDGGLRVDGRPVEGTTARVPGQGGFTIDWA